MKKKQRCFVERFAALVAALMLCSSLCVPCFALDNRSEMPSVDDFRGHQNSWYIWREFTYKSFQYFELLCSPVSVSDSDSYSVPSSYNCASAPFEFSFLNSSGTKYSYACAYPYPLRGDSGFWKTLPSFPVGVGTNYSSCVLRVYSYSDIPDDIYLFLSPVYSSSDHLLTFVGPNDSLDTASFSSPFYSYPFAFRYDTSSNHVSYSLQGGSNSSVVPRSQFSSFNSLSLIDSRFLAGAYTFSTYPYSSFVSSSDLGVVVVKKPSESYVTSASSFAPSSSVFLTFSLLVPVSLLPDVKIGDWLSDSPEDLQKALTNEFGIDSGTLKNSKDNLNSWNSTSSVDSDVASGAVGLLNGVFQNLGTFLFSVSLLCFGAVVLRMLIRKAVDG